MFMQKLGHKHYKLFLRDNKLLTGAIKRAATHALWARSPLKRAKSPFLYDYAFKI